MVIVLDTNALLSAKRPESARLLALRELAGQMSAEIFIPQIVFRELGAVALRKITDHAGKVDAALVKLNDFLSEREITALAVDPELAARDYANNMLRALGIDSSSLKQEKESSIREAIERAVHHEAPCTSGEEVRDAIIWLEALDAAEQSPDKQLVLITGDGGFSSKEQGGLLHEVLRSEASRRGIQVTRHMHLGDFLRTSEGVAKAEEAMSKDAFAVEVERYLGSSLKISETLVPALRAGTWKYLKARAERDHPGYIAHSLTVNGSNLVRGKAKPYLYGQPELLQVDYTGELQVQVGMAESHPEVLWTQASDDGEFEAAANTPEKKTVIIPLPIQFTLLVKRDSGSDLSADVGWISWDES